MNLWNLPLQQGTHRDPVRFLQQVALHRPNFSIPLHTTSRRDFFACIFSSPFSVFWKTPYPRLEKNGNPIEINGLINSKSNETQMKTKWTSIENKWNLIENQMKVQLKLNWNWIETYWRVIETQLKLNIINWNSIEN